MDMDHVWMECANAMKDSSELTVQYSINAQKTVAITAPVKKDNVNASEDGKIQIAANKTVPTTVQVTEYVKTGNANVLKAGKDQTAPSKNVIKNA